MATSYVFESFLKLTVASLYAGLRTRNRDAAYRQAYVLLRADGLGVWEQSLREITRPPTSGFVPTEMSPLVAWLTKRRTKPEEDSWAISAMEHADAILSLLGTEGNFPSKPNVAHLISACVQIRNKTKAHGAVGEDFFVVANPEYIALIRALLGTCPLTAWRWVRFYRTHGDDPRLVELRGSSPARSQSKVVKPFLNLENDGIFVVPNRAAQAYYCADLIYSDRQCRAFLLPNGGFSPTTGKVEFLDYGTGVTKSIDCSAFLVPPAPLPPSETHSEFNLDVHSNVFGNIPPLSARYVHRPHLQDLLLARLRDRNHPVITLHGRGGVGKTYLALFAAHTLSEDDDRISPFECILWLSARDIDLRLHGPAPVKQDVLTLHDMANAIGRLLNTESTIEQLALTLQDPGSLMDEGKGVLFVLDNFETLSDVREIHEFLDTHTHVPNKVLLTSRERAFKADYPIEDRGMEIEEARQLLRASAIELGISGLIDDERIDELYKYTDGHAYAMRVLAGEMAKDRKPIPLKTVLPRRLDIVQAVFERSFNRLSEHARRVFLIVSGFRSVISELAILVVLGQRDLEIESGIEECVRLSLIESLTLADGTPAYVSPQLARIFAQKKLDGDPDRLLIQEDLETIREFGILGRDEYSTTTQQDAVASFVQFCMREDGTSSERVARLESILRSVAELWPPAWLDLFEFHVRTNGCNDEKAHALRRAVEEMPYNKDVWLKRAEFAEVVRDDATRIACLVSAVEASPKDVRKFQNPLRMVYRQPKRTKLSNSSG